MSVWRNPGKKPSAKLFFAVILIFALGFVLGSHESLFALSDDDDFYQSGLVATPAEGMDLDVLWQAWGLLDSKFVDQDLKPTQIEKVRGLIEGLIESYNDPYTQFFSPEELVKFNESLEGGSFGGVGMEIGLSPEGLLQVVTPLRGTPADNAGLLPGDIIVQIDNINSLDISIDEALSLIRGPEGSEVTLIIAREEIDEPFAIKITRQNINIPILITKQVDDVFVISIYSFSQDLNNYFKKALSEYTASGAEGLIIDLRNNPGGYLQSAVDLASWFVPSGEVVVKERTDGLSGSDKLYRSKGYESQILTQNPVVFLVNKGSASASEILAGAIQDYDISPVIGDTTFGKGSVQELIELQDGSAIKVTTAKWLTPNGVSISQGGLEPDVVIGDDPETAVDEQIQAAISYVR